MERTQATIDLLNQRVHGMRPDDAHFAGSLAQQHMRRGSLSDSQWYWVETLLERYAPNTEAAPVHSERARAVGNLDVVHGWLDRAGAHGSTRGVNFATPLGQLRLSRPGSDSRYAGQQVIFVRIRGAGYVGMVRERMFVPGRAAGQLAVDAAVNLLAELAHGGVEYAAREGRRTGICCFCARGLTDERSTSVGYGPICADRFMLPWGEVAPRAEMQRRIASALTRAPAPLPAEEAEPTWQTCNPPEAAAIVAVPVALDADGPDAEDLLFM